MKKIIKKIIKQFYLKRIRYYRLKIDNNRINNAVGNTLPQLTQAEIDSIYSYWGQISTKINLKQHQLFKKINGYVDPKMLTDDVYIPYVERSLNQYEHMWFASNKSMYSVWYKELKQPINYVRCINGNIFFYNRNIGINEAIEELSKMKIDGVVIKQSIDTYGGFSTQLVPFKNRSSESIARQINHIIGAIRTDFVIQEIVRQSEETSFLNKESLNTIRITSLNINNCTTICYGQFRSGTNGSVVDNLSSGKGIMMNINEDGVLSEYAINNRYGQIKIEGKHAISSYNKIIEIVKKSHPILFPYFGIIGWDWAIDENKEPVFIEANLWYPGIYTEQLIAGKSVFGERTQEVIDYVKRHSGVIENIKIS